MLRELTGDTGRDRVIDAVWVQAERAKPGPAAEHDGQQLDAGREHVAR